MEIIAKNSPKIWKASKGHGSFLTFECGDKLEKWNKKTGKYYTGSHHLWVQYCDWEFKGIPLNSETITEDNENKLELLVGTTIRKIASDHVIFSNGVKLDLKPYHPDENEDDTVFSWFTPEKVISYSKSKGIQSEE